MAVSDLDVEQAEARMAALRSAGYARSARYDRRASRIVVGLSTGVQVAFPVRLVEGLAGAMSDDLADIEISPAGLGLHWPKLDADVYVPALLRGAFGSECWMALQPGAAEGEVQPGPKADASRNSGRKSGRPRRTAIG